MLNVLILVLGVCFVTLVLVLGMKKVLRVREGCGVRDNRELEEMIVGRLEKERDKRKIEGVTNMCVIGEQDALMRRLHKNSWSGGGVTKVNEVVGPVGKLVAEDINKDTRRLELAMMSEAKKLALEECGMQGERAVRLKKND